MILRRLTLARVRLAAAGLLLGALSACVGPALGRIELVPPLQKEEQRLKGLGTGNLENKIILITDEKYRVLAQEPRMADFAGRIEATLGKNFFVRSHSRPFFILGGMVYLDLGGREMNRAYFPGGLKASLKPGDKAVYVGTVQYHRNEFFEITKAAIVDDYERANAEFKKKFGATYPLRKALLTTVK